MENLVLKCEKLNKKFGKKQILRDVSAEVYEGDVLGFIGPNGAGKTTTIKLILGLQSITSGHVFINGFDIVKDFEKAISRVGAIVENPDLYMYLSGYDNLKLVANMYKNIDKKRIDEVVKLVGLEARIKDKVSKYSLGMRQRLGIAQAILHKPNLLILDEPTNGLDPEGIKDLRNLLKKLAKQEKMAIFISSHNLSELESFCNKVCIIKNGVVIETDNINKFKSNEENSSYIFDVSEIKSFDNVEFEKISDNEVRIFATKNDIPGIIKKLVENDVLVYEVRKEVLTLEEAFLKKTGGNKIG